MSGCCKQVFRKSLPRADRAFREYVRVMQPFMFEPVRTKQRRWTHERTIFAAIFVPSFFHFGVCVFECTWSWKDRGSVRLVPLLLVSVTTVVYVKINVVFIHTYVKRPNSQGVAPVVCWAAFSEHLYCILRNLTFLQCLVPWIPNPTDPVYFKRFPSK